MIRNNAKRETNPEKLKTHKNKKAYVGNKSLSERTFGGFGLTLRNRLRSVMNYEAYAVKAW